MVNCSIIFFGWCHLYVRLVIKPGFCIETLRFFWDKLTILRGAAKAAMDQAFQVELPLPWTRESPLTRELLVDGSVNGKTRFYQLDVWHSIHLGIGKTWIGGGVMMLSTLVPGSNHDERISVIASEYLAFCREARLDPIIRRIDSRTFGTTTDPTGTWSKAGVTSSFMLFLQQFCEKRAEAIQCNDRFRVFVPFLYVGVDFYFLSDNWFSDRWIKNIVWWFTFKYRFGSCI